MGDPRHTPGTPFNVGTSTRPGVRNPPHLPPLDSTHLVKLRKKDHKTNR